MFVKDGIAYAGEAAAELKIEKFNILDDLYVLLTFNTGEQRVFDASVLLRYPVFAPLEDKKVFQSLKLEYGVMTWLDGELDVAPEMVYENSVAYYEKRKIA